MKICVDCGRAVGEVSEPLEPFNCGCTRRIEASA